MGDYGWKGCVARPPQPEMTTDKWREITPTPILDPSQLLMTQDGVSFDGIDGGTSISGDPFPHVVRYRGEDYLTDGHHRFMRYLLGGGGRPFLARVLEVEDDA